MNAAAWLRLQARLLVQRPRRYANLFRALERRRARRIVEVGTWNGVHGRQMIETAAVHCEPRDVAYFGFDLFEALTDQQLAAEFSKRPPAQAEVRATLEATGATIRLYVGDTATTLAAARADLTDIDLVFIDGGHAEATIASDWSHVEAVMGPRTVVLFDDYYVDAAPELAGLGCQRLVDGLDRSRFSVALLEPVDRFPQPWGSLNIRMVEVRRR